MEERYPAGMPLEERIPEGAQLPPDHDHVWVESYRYLPWGDEPLDTDEPPRNPDGEPLERHTADHGEFDPELHYRVGDPGPEIVETCTVCSDTRIRRVKQPAYRAFLKRIIGGEIREEHVSLHSLEQLLGDDWEKDA